MHDRPSILNSPPDWLTIFSFIPYWLMLLLSSSLHNFWKGWLALPLDSVHDWLSIYMHNSPSDWLIVFNYIPYWLMLLLSSSLHTFWKGWLALLLNLVHDWLFLLCFSMKYIFLGEIETDNFTVSNNENMT